MVELEGAKRLLNLCANNYLGLANHPAVRAAAREAIDRYGYGMSSVRFICGTHAVHRELEQRLSAFLGTDDTILYSSCFEANGGLFETLLDERDAVISDALNHASIIDGIRLCKARIRQKTGTFRIFVRSNSHRFLAHRKKKETRFMHHSLLQPIRVPTRMARCRIILGQG